ncbi:MAG: hypothetical protein WBX25_23720 [Rhodomicrobium sp.]
MKRSALRAQLDKIETRIAKTIGDIADLRVRISELAEYGLGTVEARLALAISERSLKQEIEERDKLVAELEALS